MRLHWGLLLTTAGCNQVCLLLLWLVNGHQLQ
jgi:hypothetical protein